MNPDPFVLLGGSSAEIIAAHPIEPGRVRPHRVLDAEGLRVRLLAMDTAAVLREHRAPGPILVQVLAGGIRFRVAGTEQVLSPGGTIHVAAGVLHELEADAPSHVLLVIAG
ncbi:hypothetical protein [Microbacterium sp. USHLN186]|uniref:hypothetical protein n=1 Tax=Microbacterium sp. USHLN186 TaxID=3081286 RepID=UPI003019ABF2